MKTSFRPSRRPTATPDLVEKLKKGSTLNGKTFKVHLDGNNLLPFLKGDVKESPRKEFLYWSDDGDLMATSRSTVEGRLHGATHRGGP